MGSDGFEADGAKWVTNFPPYKVASVAELIPYSQNSRTHSDAQVAQIAASIVEFGWTNPVLVAGDGTVMAGHRRLDAARLSANHGP